MDLPQFTSFPDAPVELPFLIWHHAAQTSQTIGIDTVRGPCFQGDNLRCPLLLVNGEAKREANKSKQGLNVNTLGSSKLRIPWLLPSSNPCISRQRHHLARVRRQRG
jgi:hypothetical protein